jgi:hypothetical protein
MNTTETNRHEFEERFSHFDLSRNPLNGIYLDYGSEGAWQGWQAARERHTPISDEAIESACDVLDDNIQSCDSGESDQERMLQEARDYLWSMHFSNNPPTSEL